MTLGAGASTTMSTAAGRVQAHIPLAGARKIDEGVAAAGAVGKASALRRPPVGADLCACR